jgi:hypothetical protein
MIRGVFGLIALSTVASAATVTCAEQTLATYISYGETGCTAGLFTIKDFAWNNFGTVSVDPANVIITPVLNDGGVGVVFSGKTPETFVVTNNNTIFNFLEYFIDPPRFP